MLCHGNCWLRLLIVAWIASQVVLFGASCDFSEDRDSRYSVTDFNARKGESGTYGSTFSDVASSISQTSDGGYITGGYTWAFITLNSEPTDYWIMKVNMFQFRGIIRKVQL